jgi:drug/metabolite transporter (DMT)-like permease
LSLSGLSLRNQELYVFGAVVSAGVICGFYVAFVNLLQLPDPKIIGIVFGVGSALCWALGSVGARAELSNQANRYAAMSAAISLGFLSPLADICAAGSASLPPLAVRLCELQGWHF